MSEQDTSETHGSSIQSTNGNHVQETPKSSNILRFSLLFISIIITILVAPFFLTDNIFNICVFFATFTTLIFALTNLIIYLSKEPPHPTIIHIDSIEKENKKLTRTPYLSWQKAVHHTQQCRIAVARVMRSIFRTRWLIKTFAIALSFPISLTLTEHWKEIVGKITAVLEFFTINNKPLGISILITTLVILIAFLKNIVATFQKIMASLTSKYFVFTLASLAIIGALSALLIPSYTSWFREPGYTSAQQDSAKEALEKAQETPASTPSPTSNKVAEVEQKSTSDLRLHLLYITGGVIAILGLVETNRKNSQDHIRQVHATRRERYIEAVDKLASEQAPVRLGGVYALVGLVDEWLGDDNIDEKNRTTEGQVIINNLCAYIRSPFPLADKIDEYKAQKEIEERKEEDSRHQLSEYESERFKTILKYLTSPNEYKKPEDITADYAKFHEEQDVRRTIFDEIHKRSSNISKNERGKVVETSPGPWSAFEFDFSRAPIFYPLKNLTIEKGNFSNAKLYAEANFTGSNFVSDANFSDATFSNNAYFSEAVFDKVTFINDAKFNSVKFTCIKFNKATFAGCTEFFGAEFTQYASFSDATFTNTAIFRMAVFLGGANFSSSVFTSKADFFGAVFHDRADFSKTVFKGNAHFNSANFDSANFSGATFTQEIDFNSTIFKEYAPTFERIWEGTRARFSVQSAQGKYIFSVHNTSKRIPPGEAELDGIKYQIPVGAVLFDPDSWDKENQEYTRFSDPAKPIEESDNRGETPSK